MATTGGRACALLLAVALALGLGILAPSSAQAHGLMRAATGTASAGRPVVSALRGGAAYQPENTLSAFDHALALGVDQVEADLQLTADGQLVVIHDATLDRTTNCTGNVHLLAVAQIQHCDAGWWFTPGVPATVDRQAAPHPMRGHRLAVPTAAQLLALVGRRSTMATVNLRIDGSSRDVPDGPGATTAGLLVRLVDATGLRSRVVVQSTSPAVLAAVRRLDRHVRTQLTSVIGDGQTARQNLAAVVTGGNTISTPSSTAPGLDLTYVRAVHAAGKLFYSAGPESRTEQRQALALGADGLVTDWPACALDLEGRRAGRPGDCPSELPQPSRAQCSALAPARTSPPTGTASGSADLRVIGVQYHQRVDNVATYASFRTAVACLFQAYVVPYEVARRPTLVVFNEDIGLMTVATGARGITARAMLDSPVGGGAGDQAPAPGAALAALAQLNATYAPQIAAYQAKWGVIVPTKQVFVAATDTFVRAFSSTFSDAAREFGVYVVASNNQAAYRESFAAPDIAAFRDPAVSSGPAYVATSQVVPNTTFLWGPQDVHPSAPDGATNLLFANEKVPLTAFEANDLMLDQGPTTGATAIRNAVGYVVAGHRLGFATSLPAFSYGYPWGGAPPAGDPCRRMASEYMPCLDRLGVDTVVQAEANDGRWAGYAGSGAWQPLEWMQSAWRAVSDPSVHFRYAINPMMVGNLADLPFDGQSSILARSDPRAFASHYVGTASLQATDPAADRRYAGDQPGFLALAPWVRPDAARSVLQAEAAALAPGSASPERDHYLQTAVFADLLPAPRGAPHPARRHGTRVGAGNELLPRTGGLSALWGLVGIVLLTAAVGLAGASPSRRR